MRTLIAATMTVALSGAAFAQMGNITGTEYSGEPYNSSVRSSAKNPDTGLTPGGERAYGQVHKKIYVKKKKRHPSVYVPAPRGY